MTKIEKIIVCVIVILVIIMGASFYNVSRIITNNGGMKQTIIQAGKEIKDITKEIQK